MTRRVVLKTGARGQMQILLLRKLDAWQRNCEQQRGANYESTASCGKVKRDHRTNYMQPRYKSTEGDSWEPRPEESQ